MTNKATKKRVSKEVSEALATVGRAGGKATAKRLGKKGMAALGKKGAQKRWAGHTKAKAA